MTPKEKAEQLVEKFLPLADKDYDHGVVIQSNENAKECALVCVDEIIPIVMDHDIDLYYWDAVKEHIILI